MSAERASYWLWGIWFTTWWLAAFWASRAAARPRLSAHVLHRLVTGIGVLLLFWVPSDPGRLGASAWAETWSNPPLRALARPLWQEPPIVGWALLALTIAGFGFCWWARLHLGKLWSGLVTTKAGHRIVDSGPYALVRHPIYTGVIFAAFATASIKASPAAYLGALLILVGFWMTARIEEGFLREQLGSEAYDAYSRRTPMLLPLVGRGR